MVIACFLLSVGFAVFAAVYVFAAGYGVLAAFAAYSLVGASVLLMSMTIGGYLFAVPASPDRDDMS